MSPEDPNNLKQPEISAAPPKARATLSGVVRIVVFFSLFIAIAEALQLTFDHGLRSIKTSKFGALNSVMSGKADSEIIINGSSRALAHYDPAIIQQVTGHSAYNIGMNSSQTDFQLAILRAYLKHNIKPRLVIQNLDAFSFVTTARGDIYDPALYMPYIRDDALYLPLYQIDPVVWKWRHIPLYGYAVDDMRFTWLSGLLAYLGFQGREDYFRGFNPRTAAWNDDFRNFTLSHPNGIAYPIEPKGVESLIEIIQTCLAEHVPIVLVYSPEYAEMQALEKNRLSIFQEFRDIARRFDIQFIDYSSSQICEQKSLFQNSQHLNSDGASVFSTDLSHRLVSGHLIP